MKTKINDSIKYVLEEFDEKYFIDDNINKNKVIQDLDDYNKELIEAFLNNEVVKKNFTIEIAGSLIMLTNKLVELFESDEYWKSSYTKYSKKIGLSVSGKFIDESSDVVLDFPYKDTVLKAGMSKENIDRNDIQPEEPFLNEVIAREEIDVLLDKKILMNARKYDSAGSAELDSFDESNNLIIKGNNLLALHTIKEKYAGKIKMIYIDPPYNTGGDSFHYNDKFNRSSWLSFMKSRLEIARELLDENGTLWISIDSNESHYLKVLTDSIFGRENFVEEIIWQRAYAPVNLKKTFSKSHDAILVYAKSFHKDFELNRLPRNADTDSRYKNPDNDPRGVWKTSDLSVGPAIEKNIYEITTPSGRKVFPPSGRSWVLSYERFEEFMKDNRIWFGSSGNNVPSVKRFLSEVREGIVAQTLWTYQEVGHNQDAKRELKKLFTQDLFTTPKPEKLMHRIITLGSNENDLILDFFMGSATTQAVAHKMNRRYIGIEQMDYINTISVPRLQKVIEGEQGGISKEVEWNGGGSFVYVELMEKNRGFLTSIQNAETASELRNIFTFMLEEAEIDFRVDLEKVKDTINELSLEEQKKILIKIIDKNQLYYNYSEIDDVNVRDLISETDYSFNKSFYN